MGIKTVSVYSSADKENLHVKLADEAYCIGPAPSSKSYLNGDAIITVALRTGCEAIHPGVGFLSENASFARDIEKAGLIWIGPEPETIELLGNKVVARETALKHGLPVTPGSEGATDDLKKAEETAEKCGYPVIIKAASGGGGKGMRIVWKKEELAENLKIASSEALSNFADGTVYVEKYIVNPRHVELQVIADGKGGVAILGERDCSVQKNHQKLIEESPSPFISESLRKKMGKAAQSVAEAVGYITVGTVEFLVDKHMNFYFMEMNTRIQVEHPITEVVTGIDLVKEQIRLAAGERLNIDSSSIKIKNHAIECRINAEDPDKDFIPSPGKIGKLYLPGGAGIRIDTHVYSGYTIPPFYDSLIAKIIAYAPTREETISKMSRALKEVIIEGIKNTAPLHAKIMSNEYFHKGNICTDFLPKYVFNR